MGISSLRALAFQLPFTEHPIAPILASRKGEVFTALFLWDRENSLQRQGKDDCFRINEFPSLFYRNNGFRGKRLSQPGPAVKRTARNPCQDRSPPLLAPQSFFRGCTGSGPF
jgi:hypothetical protein